MTKTSIAPVLLPILLFLVAAPTPSSAQVQSNQTSTTCINGKCTTVSGSTPAKTTVVRRIPTTPTFPAKAAEIDRSTHRQLIKN